MPCLSASIPQHWPEPRIFELSGMGTTAVDYAHVLKDLSDTHFPKSKKIVLVQDNLNT
jgi:hypothetical protein